MDHTLQHPIGLFHLATALFAVAIGALVVLSRKGTKRHKWLGRSYVVAMLAVNATAFVIYELFGGFGLLHWMAVLSLLSVLVGYWPAISRRSGWKEFHAYFMSGSYVGLVAALAAETLTRWTSLPFMAGVGIVSFAVSVVGVWLMFRFIPRLL